MRVNVGEKRNQHRGRLNWSDGFFSGLISGFFAAILLLILIAVICAVIVATLLSGGSTATHVLFA